MKFMVWVSIGRLEGDTGMIVGFDRTKAILLNDVMKDDVSF